MVKKAQFIDKLTSGKMLVFDLETDGLLNDITVFTVWSFTTRKLMKRMYLTTRVLKSRSFADTAA